MWQDAVMVALVGVAGGYLAWRLWRGWSGRAGCGCGGCSAGCSIDHLRQGTDRRCSIGRLVISGRRGATGSQGWSD
jgi:hypothetical protein